MYKIAFFFFGLLLKNLVLSFIYFILPVFSGVSRATMRRGEAITSLGDLWGACDIWQGEALDFSYATGCITQSCPGRNGPEITGGGQTAF